MVRLRRVVCSLLMFGLLPGVATADGSPEGFPLCTVDGDQLAPVSLPRFSGGMPGARGAMLFWQDLRGWPGDAGDLWLTQLFEPWTGDILPVDGQPAVQRPGEQSQPAATLVWTTWQGCQWCRNEALVLAYADADGGSPNRVLRAKRLQDSEHDWDVALSDPARDAYDPMAVGDRAVNDGTASGALVAWLDAGATWEGRLRAQHLAADGSRTWGEAGLAVVSDSSGQDSARMIADGADGAYFAWTDQRHGDDLAIYAMRLAGDGSPASGWAPEGRLVRTSGALPQSPLLASDGSGGVLVMWHEIQELADLSHGLQPRMVRLLGNGSLAPGWPVDGVRLAVRDDVPVYVNDLQADGAGGVVAAMTALGATGGRVFVQRLLLDGMRPAGWPAVGLEASASLGSQGEPRLATDAGMTTVVWRDERDGPLESDIYAARFRPDGTRPVGWPAAGLAVGQANGIQRSPVVAPQHYGGVVIAWSDARWQGSSGWDIYGQTVNAQGRLDVEAMSPPAALELTTVGPQPASGTVRFRLGLGTGTQVTAEVFDLAGRRLARLVDGPLQAGWHTLEWSGHEAADGGAPGVRFLRVRTASGERTLRFVALR